MVGDMLMLDVGNVGHGGFCVARHPDGRAVFVRHAIPGERVRAVVTEDKARYLRADAVEVVSASPDRLAEPCPYARPGRCGGCDWQHVSRPAQLRLKAAVVREQLQRLAGLDVPVVVEDAGPPDGLGWRTRVTFAVQDDGVVGLRRHRSNDIEPVDRCLIAHPLIEDVGVERKQWPGTATVEVIAGAATGDRAVVATPAVRRADVAAPPLDAKASLLKGDARGGAEPLRGRPGVREEALGRTWRVSGSGFWQVHPAAAETLAGAVVALLRPASGEFALDLYAGVGLFAAALAPALGAGGRVIAVESDERAVADAAHNLADLPMVITEAGRVEAVLTRLGLRRCDLVVLDPPRTGAGADVTRRIAALRPRGVAYVACDPASLARDVATFAECGYRLSALRAFDLFPMTAHVECVALLEPAT
ncbi:MAG TPA: TRAM domain-containing protein [Mycobacteriales bacterium]|jgi:tRNA/tmRNA/rRNA uracil-C5-methylase (TrmA/RlmC/RlmD family)|nr:TRAM domain-containing protein [Mycobacteriales bacterium]